MTVRVEGITKRFAGQVGAPAVENVSFSARAGVITTLLGPSGSGKSTLLRVIAGLEHPDSGKVFINGLESTRVSPRQRNVGFVFQNYALFRHMTVFENVAFGMRVRKRPQKDVRARVEELLELVQLAGYATRFPGQLSGGQRQRVALARALATSPQVLLLDEPFGALDARVRLELREWLLGFQERALVTTLMVTHDQDEALELSEQIVLLNQGKIEQSGSPHDLYDSPSTPFVASFIGGGSELRGTVNGGRAAVGSLELRAPDGVPDGVSVRALVRPHDIRLAKNPENEQGLTLARVDRMRRIGPSVKLLLELANGEPITVTMAKAELDELGIIDGDKVFIDLRHAKLFIDDYVI